MQWTETSVMDVDRRTLLISLASTAATLALPKHALGALATECFAAALFSLNGDMRSVELPGRGHEIALRPDGGHWVAFARRPGRFGVAVPVGAGQPIWFATKSDRHFFGHGVFSADGRLL